MNILEIGHSLKPQYTRKINFLSNNYFLDADMLVIDLDAVFMEFYGLFEHSRMGGKVIAKNDFISFIEQVQKRKLELHQYFKAGGNLLLFQSDRSLKKFKVADGEALSDSAFDFLSIFGLNEKKFQTKEVIGHNIINHPAYDFFFREFYATYEVVYMTYEGKAVAQVAKTGEPVALNIPVENGNIVILPKIELHYKDEDDDEYRFQRLFAALERLNSELKEQKASVSAISLPDWVRGYHIGNEKKDILALHDLISEADELRQRIEKQQAKMEQYNQLKILLFGSGRNLEEMVERIFKSFGYEILESVANRDDVIIKYREQIGVIEVKGVNGSSGEKQAAQLEKWVAEYTIDHDIVPKGILIVNAFRDKSLDERKEKTFPQQMLKYSKGREQCLLSTTQLLDIYLSFTEGKLTSDQVHEMLFSTIGEVAWNIKMIEKTELK